MAIITIPKKLARKDDLVVIPRKEYEILLRRRPKVISVVKLSEKEARAIEKSDKELVHGAYVTLEDFENELGRTHTKTR
ncbi:MAG: hypothetical protein HYW90_02860 [Candidatus Sungbacteria bacterium]|nr:hypothetical protein [Candidatus Sungbacteria bacterium]